MDYNFHTHTRRCSHASGTEEEYILRAIEGGIRFMGFSDHIPLRFPDGYETKSVRVPTDQACDYFRDLQFLRKKYRDQIEIFIGFEMEYFPDYFDSMLNNAKNWGAEYLILGQHYLRPEHPSARHTNLPSAEESELERYADLLVAAMKTGVFTYVAHPDVFCFTGNTEFYQNTMRKVACTSAKLGIPLEINFYGIRDHRRYPYEAFWEIAGQEGSPVTFGFDSHTAKSAFDSESLPSAMALVEKYNLNYIGKPSLVSL